MIFRLFMRLIIWATLHDVPRKYRLLFVHWSTVALVIGWNELAKQQHTIEQKTACRMFRCILQNVSKTVGFAEVPFTGDNPIAFVIPTFSNTPGIEFRESDWELMRIALAAHDLEESR